MDSTEPQPTRKATPQYDGAAGIPFAMVMRYWWHIDPSRPGAVWQYYLATAVYNTAIACVLTLFFMMGNANAPLGNLFFETLVVSQCIGFCIHTGFDSFYTFTSDAWRAGLSVVARRAWHFAIPILGVYLGYTIAFALKGRNFFTILLNYPRAGMLILMVGMLVSFIWFLVMDGQTRRLRAEAEEARAREAAVASQQQAKEAELRALQAQIEPHFLFNTLANVQALIDYEPTKARQMLESFIEYLRATLDASRRTQGTLGDEVAMLQRYLQLMQVRMGTRLKAEWDIDPTLLSHPLAPLLLQPLVENAIKYGLEPQIQGGTVWVSASRHEGRVRIEVRDNGMGLNTQSASRKKTVEGGGTGLKNVTARLHSTFGEGATLTLANTPDGCSAIIEFDSLQDHSPIATL